MRSIDSCSAQHTVGHTNEVATLPTTQHTLADGTVFRAADGSTFVDVDTGKVYVLVGGRWYQLGA